MRPNDPKEPNRPDDAEAALGGADAVEKTTYVADVRGAEPDDPRDGQGSRAAMAKPVGGPALVAWAMAVLLIAALVAYLVGTR